MENKTKKYQAPELVRAGKIDKVVLGLPFGGNDIFDEYSVGDAEFQTDL